MNPSDKKELTSLYRQKAGDSFKTRFNLLLYYRTVLNDMSPISIDEMDQFKIMDHEESLEEYINVYWQQELNYEIRGVKIENIYKVMEEWKIKNKDTIADLRKHYVDVTFQNVFPFNAFVRFCEKNEKCDYCNTTLRQINDLINSRGLNKKHITRGWTMEIDRKKPNHEYTEENVVWSCYWCNNAKTDEFTYEEFKKIGKIIEGIWNGRLHDQ